MPRKIYVVRDIIDLKIQNGKEVGLIWWQNYRKKAATWEPIQNMTWKSDYEEYFDKIRRRFLKKSKAIRRVSNKQSTIKNKKNQAVNSNSPKKRGRPANQQAISSSKNGIDDIQKKEIDEQQIKTKKKQIKEEDDEEQLEEQSKVVPTCSKIRKKSKVDLKNIKFRIKNEEKSLKLTPIRLQLNLPNKQKVPFMQYDLKWIERAIMDHNYLTTDPNQMKYECVLEKRFPSDSQDKMSSIIDHNLVKLVWPQQLAEYLITKINAPDRSSSKKNKKKAE